MSRTQRLRVLDHVRAQLPSLTQSTVDTVRTAVPAYRDMHGEQLHDVEAITAWAIMRALQTWADGGSGLDDADRARFRGIGAARAKDGRPLTAVLRAYRVAAVTVTDTLREVGRGQLDHDDVSDLTTVWLTALDDLSEALMTGYDAARDRLGADLDRARRDLLDDLLVGRQSSAGALTDRSRQLGIDLPPTTSLLLVEPIDPAASIKETAAISLFATEHTQNTEAPQKPLLTLRGRRAVVLLLTEPGHDLDRACQDRGWRGCLIEGHPITDTAAVLRLAGHALDTAPDHAFRGRTLLNQGDAHFLALLSAQHEADPAALVRTVLGQTATAARQHLSDGLAAFLAAQSVTTAATWLHVHPQTLRYRLRRIHESTGRDPHDPWHHLVLSAAVHLHRIQEQST